MMDVALQVCWRAPKESPQPYEWNAGDLVGVHRAKQIGTMTVPGTYVRAPNQRKERSVWLFITGVPIDDIKEFTLPSDVEWLKDKDSGLSSPSPKNKCNWKVVWPSGLTALLSREGFACQDWETAKTWIVHKRKNKHCEDSDLDGKGKK